MSTGHTVSDYEVLDRCHGLYAGQLNEEEMAAFNRLCRAGLAHRSYNDVAGLLGLAKVCIHPLTDDLDLTRHD